jgi:hypothetical protein
LGRKEKDMNRKQRTKFIHEGDYLAEVDVDLIETDEGWSPDLALEDASRLDDVRAALRAGDLETAAGIARVFRLTPVKAGQTAGADSYQSDGR